MAKFHSDEDKLLIRKAIDKQDISLKRYDIQLTGFLNEREQDILLGAITSSEECEALLCGGYEAADRRAMVFVPQYLELDMSECFAAIRCSFYKEYELTHRDFLGALMGLGIQRDSVGDIIVNKKGNYADIVVKKDIKDFILSELFQAGRASLKLTEIPLLELSQACVETQEITDTVASPRLDAIVSSGFGISRENAAALIKSGKVYLNRRLAADIDKAVTDGSLINALGYGKFKVCFTGGVSKKGRIFIKIEKFV